MPVVEFAHIHWRFLTQTRSQTQFVQATWAVTKNHSGPSKSRGFTRPSSLPKDFTLCEVRLDNKLRIHGCLNGNTFYLVWLDKNHAVFPSGK